MNATKKTLKATARLLVQRFATVVAATYAIDGVTAGELQTIAAAAVILGGIFLDYLKRLVLKGDS